MQHKLLSGSTFLPAAMRLIATCIIGQRVVIYFRDLPWLPMLWWKGTRRSARQLSVQALYARDVAGLERALLGLAL